jgi:hypothetical protein
LVELYFESVGAAQERDVHKLFGWQRELTTRTIAGLVEKGKLIEVDHPSQKGEWVALIKLI